jgi:hypothetical protein
MASESNGILRSINRYRPCMSFGIIIKSSSYPYSWCYSSKVVYSTLTCHSLFTTLSFIHSFHQLDYSPYTCIRDVVTSIAGKFASKLISNRWANVEEVKHMDDPILIIHGQRDTLIPFSHSEVSIISFSFDRYH